MCNRLKTALKLLSPGSKKKAAFEKNWFKVIPLRFLQKLAQIGSF
jgi:hypothetical protein